MNYRVSYVSPEIAFAKGEQWYFAGAPFPNPTATGALKAVELNPALPEAEEQFNKRTYELSAKLHKDFSYRINFDLNKSVFVSHSRSPDLRKD
jgi:hypothetical protein